MKAVNNEFKNMEVLKIKSHLIRFELVDWISNAKGVRFKRVSDGRRTVRLVEFTEGFSEKDYCLKGHVAYVLEGSFSVDYYGKLERYEVGDTIFISPGNKDRHKAIVAPGERVLLLMWELEESAPEIADYCI